jgi:hypothetical protein
MNRTLLIPACALAFLFAGCGRHSANIDGAGNVDTGNPDAGADATPSFNLRLTGVDPGDYVSARMRIQAVRVEGGGAVLADTVKTPEVELTDLGNSFLLASFRPPAGVEDVDFTVSFEGGMVATRTASFDVNTRCQTLRLSGKVSRISERKHAVIHLDLARSFVPSGAAMMMVPHFQLVY